MSSAEEPDFLVVGYLSRAHGTRGALLVQPLTDRPEQVFAEGNRLLLGDDAGGPGPAPEERRVLAGKPYKRGWMLDLEGVEDRTAAEDLRGRYLLVPATEVGGVEEGEFFYHQLLGLTVETVEGSVVGEVREVYETEPRHMLEVKGEERLHLVPFDRRIVLSVELDEGRVIIDPPEGLLEL